MRKIKILYQVNPRIYGGVEGFLLNLIKNINKKRFEPTVYSYGQGKVLNEFKKLGIEVKVIDTKDNTNLVNLVAFLKRKNFDIAQTSNFIPALALASQRAGIPHIWRASGSLDIAVLNKSHRPMLINLIVLMSKVIICPSHFIKKQFPEAESDKIKVIYNGLDLNKVNNIRSTKKILKKFGCKKDDFVIGMIAHLYPQKRHIDFIRAANIVQKRLGNVKFIIVGFNYSGRENQEYIDYLDKNVKNMHLNDKIVFAGFQKNILEIIAALDLTVLPSVNEGASNAIMESMALGKPVITTNSGGNSEFVQDGLNGLIVPVKNPKGLAAAIINTLENPGKSKKMGLAGKTLSKNIFDIKRAVCEYEKIYESVYKERSRNRT